jgi:hypothetical protein
VRPPVGLGGGLDFPQGVVPFCHSHQAHNRDGDSVHLGLGRIPAGKDSAEGSYFLA